MSNQDNILFKETEATHWAHIILPLALPQVYTYALPSQLLNKAMPGCRVEVVFGKNKKYAGIIKSITTQKPAYSTKAILNVLDDAPLLYEQQLKLWEWVSQYYMCTEGEVMAAALPANFKLSSETTLIFNDEIGEDFTHLSDDEFVVAEALLLRKQLQLIEVQQLLDATHVYPVIKKLIDKNVCFIWEELNERYKVKKENYILLQPQFSSDDALSKILNEWKGAPKQMELLLAFLHLQKT